jgi:hypothetical protein
MAACVEAALAETYSEDIRGRRAVGAQVLALLGQETVRGLGMKRCFVLPGDVRLVQSDLIYDRMSRISSSCLNLR